MLPMTPVKDMLFSINGLTTRADLNNRIGRLFKLSKHNGRFAIEMLTDKERIWVKPQNLLLLSRLLLASTSYAMTERQAAEAHFHSNLMATDAPLTETEKVEALRIGQWGDNTSPLEWGEFVRAVKEARGGEGCYPNDWHDMIILGKLFPKSTHPFQFQTYCP